MEKQFVLFFIILFGVLFVEAVRHDGIGMCPKFDVRRNSIIRTRDSKARGARMIYKNDVDSARDCVSLCCETENCNVGIIKYSHHHDEDEDGDRISRKCYLFDCKTPNVCVFVNHTNYAVIELKRKPQLEESIEETSISKCPPNVPVAMCADDPCRSASCSSYPDAKCKPNYCGGCNTEFFVDGSKVKCDEDTTTQRLITQPSTSIATEAAEVEEGQSVSEEVEINPEDAGDIPTENYELQPPTEDPYAVHEWRKFLTHPDEKELYKTTDTPTTGNIDSTATPSPVEKVKYLEHGTASVPLLIALIACIIVLIAVIWRLRCSGRGKLNKKFAVDDGDYLINGMYL